METHGKWNNQDSLGLAGGLHSFPGDYRPADQYLGGAMLLPYGLVVATALMGDGTSMFDGGTRGTITMPDWAELAEGVNERYAASAYGNWPFVQNTNGYWSFTRFRRALPVIPFYDGYFQEASLTETRDVSLISLMWEVGRDDSKTLPRKFIREYTATNVFYWTSFAGGQYAPLLYQAAGVGLADGTNAFFTLGIMTNGMPIYTNSLGDNPSIQIPLQVAWTGLLWEIYRIQGQLDKTLYPLTEPFAGTNFFDGGSTGIWYVAEMATGVVSVIDVSAYIIESQIDGSNRSENIDVSFRGAAINHFGPSTNLLEAGSLVLPVDGARKYRINYLRPSVIEWAFTRCRP
jgi:hypothetical protein